VLNSLLLWVNGKPIESSLGSSKSQAVSTSWPLSSVNVTVLPFAKVGCPLEASNVEVPASSGGVAMKACTLVPLPTINAADAATMLSFKKFIDFVLVF
jgi:hypothetical protein